MAYQTIFKRYELKYLLTKAQKDALLTAMIPYMEPDRYGKSVIRNIYFDTESYRMIRHSLERPVYKEKLRVRSYETASPDSTVFVELKKKYDRVVYKRRIALPESKAMDWLCHGAACSKQTQIAREIEYCLRYYGDLRPTVFLSYEREAYYPKDGSEFRITFDENILCRRTALSLTREPYGIPILPEDTVLMELKCTGGIPLWMVKLLSEHRLYKTSYSKYGTAYQTIILPEKEKENEHIQRII